MGILNFEGSGDENANLPFRRPPIISSKIGTDFIPWHNASEGSVGNKYIGKVFVDCKFRFADTEWGVLGQTPAGIIYIDIRFGQPKNHLLESATVQISLSEHKPSKREKWIENGLVIGEYGPKTLAGKPTVRYNMDTYSLTPDVDVLGATIGGVGVNRQRASTSSSRWEFHCSQIPGDPDDAQGGSIYRTLRWELSQNDFTRYPEHNDVFHTGLSFKHSARPFYIQVKIKGHLRRMSDRIKGLFPPKLRPKQGEALTLIEINSKYRTGKPLDSAVRGLEHRMNRKNKLIIPEVSPDVESIPPQQPAPSHGNDTSTQISPELCNKEEHPKPMEPTRLGTRSLIETLSSAPSTYSSIEEESSCGSNTAPSSTGSVLRPEADRFDAHITKVKDTKLTEEKLRLLLSNRVLSTMLGLMFFLFESIARMKKR